MFVVVMGSDLFVLAGLHIRGEVFADGFADGGVIVFDGVVVVAE